MLTQRTGDHILAAKLLAEFSRERHTVDHMDLECQRTTGKVDFAHVATKFTFRRSITMVPSSMRTCQGENFK